MSTIVRTDECFPGVADQELSRWFGWKISPREARHELCPRGQHTPGVLGGWHCPCDCHATRDNPASPVSP